jgi:hypothetical protein
MTKQELIRQAEELEAQELEADGSWAEHLHAQAQLLRAQSVTAPEEEEDQ